MLHHSDKSGNMDDKSNIYLDNGLFKNSLITWITSTMLLCCAVQSLSGRLFMVLRILLHTKQMSHLKCHMFYNIVK